MADPQKYQLKLQLKVLQEFCNRYARHCTDCAWLTVAGPCTCGYDGQVRRLKDIWELLFPDAQFNAADPLAPVPSEVQKP